MNKIKVYDMDAFLKSKYPEYKPFRFEKVAIFEGLNGLIFAEEEAVHQRANVPTDQVVIPLCKRPSPGHMNIMASAELKISLDEIISEAPYAEKTIEEFFNRRNYNPRCENNYATLMSSLRNIGFDLHGYFKDKPSIEEQISAAEQEQTNVASAAKEKASEINWKPGR